MTCKRRGRRARRECFGRFAPRARRLMVSSPLARGIFEMGTDDKKNAPATGAVGNESHYHSRKDRVFVRGIQGNYSMKEELARLRAMPRVRKGRTIKFT